MSRTATMIAKPALCAALLLAASPAREHSPVPLAGVRTALELIAKTSAARAPRTGWRQIDALP